MYLTTSQRREECANNPHAGIGPDAVAAVIVHGVQSLSLSTLNATDLQFLQRFRAHNAVADFHTW